MPLTQAATSTAVQALRDLATALDALLEVKEDASISLATLRHRLSLLGLTPSERALGIMLLERFDAVPDRPRQEDGTRPRTFQGVGFREGALENLTAALHKRWNKTLAKAGLPEDLPGDPASDSDFTTDLATARSPAASGTSLANRVENVHARKAIADGYYTKLAEYFWRTCHWASYSPFDRAVVERRLDTGDSHAALGRHFGVKSDVIKRILRLHELKAGWTGRKTGQKHGR